MIDETRAPSLLEALRHFVETPLDVLLAPASDEEVTRSLHALVRDVATSVPAYRAFLAEEANLRIADIADLESLDAFERLPLATRDNYLRKHRLADLVWEGRLEACDMVAVSSGSTGEPGFWPRSQADELAIAVRFEQVFRDAFTADRKKTLAVVCFALGTWVGGMFTAACCRHLASKGYPITVVTPGNNVAEILRVVRGLSGSFEQTVLLGYPPFLKDVIDQGRAAALDWSALSLKLVTAGEVFSEEWRTLVCDRAGIDDPCRGVASLYGTADAGVLANETPLSVAIRRFLNARLDLVEELFGERRLPTLAQYDPRSRYFEAIDGRLVFSGRNGVPLVRYAMGDSGGVVRYEAMMERLARAGFEPPQEGRQLPFVYVFGRTHFAVSYFGANVFPETIAVGLEQPAIAPYVTGKFVLESKEGLEGAAHLALAVELAADVLPAPESPLAEAIASAVLAQLLAINSEFANYVPPASQLPRVTLYRRADPEWFPTGVKHRYTRR